MKNSASFSGILENDLVMDPFAGSNVTGHASENLRRRWVSIEAKKEYVLDSQVRFEKIVGIGAAV